PADIRTNGRLADLISAADWPAPGNAPIAWLGDPVAIKEAAGVTLRRQSGANLIVTGREVVQPAALQCAAVMSHAEQQAAGRGAAMNRRRRSRTSSLRI